MAVNYGPSTIRGGLVMHFDMANRQKSWKGAPTTNLVNPSWASWSVDGSGQGSIGTRTITSPYECLISDTAANTRQSIYVTGLAGNTTYTFSVQYKKQFGAPTLRFQLQAYNGGSYISTMIFATTVQLGLLDIEGWQTAKYTVTTPAGTTQVLWFMQDGDDYTTYTHSFILANPQCEQQGFASPFVAGTRSNTQAILDLTGTNTITATSLTYNSDNTFSFNGSNNYLETANNIITGNSPFTFECFYTLSGQTGGEIFGNYGSGYSSSNYIWISGQYGLYIGGAVYFPGAPIANGTYHMACSRDTSGNCILYKNGIQVNSGTLTGSIAAGPNFRIGIDTGGTGEPFSGKIYSQRLYNRVLSANEVAQNFNAQRGIYGL